jgi:hypothetical protein
MPRPTRAFNLIDTTSRQLVSSPYICRSCRHVALRQRLTSRQSLRHASSEEISLTEKARRKIWATEKPPALADPYDGESFLARRRKERAREKEAQELKQLEEEQGPRARPRAIAEDADNDYVPKQYVASETWDGLEHVGHKGHWRDIPPKLEDHFVA